MSSPIKFRFFPKIAEISFLHRDKLDKSCAFSSDEEINMLLSISRRSYLDSVELFIYNENAKCLVLCKSFSYVGSYGESDRYSLSFSPSELGVGLYFAKICISSFGKKLYGHQNGTNIIFTENEKQTPDIQLSVSDFLYEKPAEFYGGIIYQIFVDRFNRGGESKKREDAVLVENWENGVPEFPEYPGAPLKNNTFYGGTLDGIRDKLDYIQSIGANIIYLSPIFEAASNHKYDTGDYMTVDAMFGGDKALERLICECKRRGIKLILDGVFNHTGADSIYFNRYARYNTTGAYQSQESEYFDWYNFKEFPNKYDAWWGIEILPRLNLAEKSCRDYFLGKGGVVEKYANMGIDGLRLDVADELTDDFIADIKKILSRHPSSILYGEVWEDASNKVAYDTRKQYYLGKELDGVMNYPLRTGLINYVLTNDISSLRYALTDIIMNAPKRVTDAQMNLLGSHDTPRILTAIGDQSCIGASNAVLRTKRMTKAEREVAEAKLKSLYCILATLPGIPTVFYGDEAGLEGYSDPFNRMPYPWGKESNDLFRHYKCIGEIRRNNAVYATGGFAITYLSEELFAFKRYDGKNTLLTVYNNSQFDLSLNFGCRATNLFKNSTSYSYVLNSKCACIYKVRDNDNLTIVKNK